MQNFVHIYSRLTRRKYTHEREKKAYIHDDFVSWARDKMRNTNLSKWKVNGNEMRNLSHEIRIFIIIQIQQYGIAKLHHVLWWLPLARHICQQNGLLKLCDVITMWMCFSVPDSPCQPELRNGEKKKQFHWLHLTSVLCNFVF